MGRTRQIRRHAARWGIVALLPIAGFIASVGLAGPAGADPGPNLLTNGSFEAPVIPANPGYVTVNAGDSTTIPGWTVVTPAIYGGTGGSVDVVSSSLWNVEDGNNSIDLAGSTTEAGGLYQDVATTSGSQYTLTWWSAVNSSADAGSTHTIDVIFDGTVVGTSQGVAVGYPLQWVQNQITVTADSTTSRVEFDDVTPGDALQGPTLDNVSFVAGSPVPVVPEAPVNALLVVTGGLTLVIGSLVLRRRSTRAR